MFNLFVSVIAERMAGRKLTPLLAELTGVGERTWRYRFKRGWAPDERQRHALDRRFAARQTDRLIRAGGWPAEEAASIVANAPSALAGASRPTTDLVYWTSQNHGAYCRQTLALAAHFDDDCARLLAAVQAADLDATRAVLADMLDWLAAFVPAGGAQDDLARLRTRLAACAELDELLAAAQPLQDALVLHLMSCWDLEFCSGYFDATMQAHPMFELVMPRFETGIELEPGSGRLLREGRQPRGRIIEGAMSRLLDVVAFLLAWIREGRLPGAIPRVKDLAAWSGEDEARLVSWRDETTHLGLRQLEALWMAANRADQDGIYPALPMPMFVFAHFCAPLRLRADERVTGLVDISDGYRAWWECNRARMVGAGLQFGTQAWPDCLAAREPGTGLAALHQASRSP